ncbi:invasion associated locus B family protein [Granulibacter bethesdensis]|nr:invasion associated locus B family protein [Granulibacter bethesdensis]
MIVFTKFAMVLLAGVMIVPAVSLAKSDQVKSVSEVAPAMSSPASSSAQVSAKPGVVSQVFGDWIYRCQEVAAPAEKLQHPVCEIAQQMLLKQEDKLVPILTLAFMAEAPGKPYTATVVAPLGVQLKSALALSADGGHTTTLEYQFCDNRGCFARSVISSSFLSQFRHGRQGHVRIVMSNGRGVTLNFALNGVAEALAAFESGKAPIAAHPDSSVNAKAISSASAPKP